MQDSSELNQETNESPEPSTAPSPQPATDPFINPGIGLAGLVATYEMIVGSRKAIRNAKWGGDETECIAMLQAMLAQMENQYRVQVERGRAAEKDMRKKAEAEIRKAGGKIAETNAIPS